MCLLGVHRHVARLPRRRPRNRLDPGKAGASKGWALLTLVCTRLYVGAAAVDVVALSQWSSPSRWARCARRWPSEDREALLETARSIEAERAGVSHVSGAKRAAIDRGLDDARAGRFASKDGAAKIRAKFRGE